MYPRPIAGVAVDRHGLAELLGAFGFASIGAGVASFLWYPAVAEIETRVGTALGPRKRLLLGGQVRLGVDFFYREKVPLPQLGIFTGMSFL